MNAIERIEAAISLKPVDRMPVAPLIISFAGRCAGMTQAELFGSFRQWQHAMQVTFERVGECDAVFPMWPRDAAVSQPLRALLPGRDLEDDAQFQLVEAEVMTRQDYTDHRRARVHGLVRQLPDADPTRTDRHAPGTHQDDVRLHPARDSHEAPCVVLAAARHPGDVLLGVLSGVRSVFAGAVADAFLLRLARLPGSHRARLRGGHARHRRNGQDPAANHARASGCAFSPCAAARRSSRRGRSSDLPGRI